MIDLQVQWAGDPQEIPPKFLKEIGGDEVGRKRQNAVRSRFQTPDTWNHSWPFNWANLMVMSYEREKDDWVRLCKQSPWSERRKSRQALSLLFASGLYFAHIMTTIKRGHNIIWFVLLSSQHLEHFLQELTFISRSLWQIVSFQLTFFCRRSLMLKEVNIFCPQPLLMINVFLIFVLNCTSLVQFLFLLIINELVTQGFWLWISGTGGC